jgi:prepilin-type N-terminal cleavage/methylation domain-containing protein/prepilin-type processing-associated H-X9-DG protein
MKRRGFTLVELLVSLAIIGLLVGLTMAGVQRVRQAAAKIDCQNHLKQVVLAGQNYHAAIHTIPPGCRTKNDPHLYMSWLTRLLPYLEQQAAYDDATADFKRQPLFSFPLDGHVNLARPMKAFVCPLADRSTGNASYIAMRPEPFPVAFTWYLGVSGTYSDKKDGVLFADGVVRLTDITDGTSNTIMIGERPPSPDDRFGWWYVGAGQDVSSPGSAEYFLGAAEYRRGFRLPMCEIGPHRFGPDSLDNLCGVLHFWSRHTNGANFAFADGSVRFLSYSAADILPALATRAGRETATVE